MIASCLHERLSILSFVEQRELKNQRFLSSCCEALGEIDRKLEKLCLEQNF